MKNLKFITSKSLFIFLISLIGFIVLGTFLYNSFRTYEPANAKINELSIPNSLFKVFYSSTDQENTTRLYSQLITGQDKKLLYQNNPRFQHQLLKTSKKILILQRDKVLLLNEDGSIYKELFTVQNKKWIGEESWQVNPDEKLVSFTLYDYDDEYKIDPIAYELNVETGSYKIIGGNISRNDVNKNEPISAKGVRAEIREGSLLVDDDEIIHWPNYDYKFNSGCSSPQWLPFDNLLIVTCGESLRIVDINTGKHAELDKGYKLDWFN